MGVLSFYVEINNNILKINHLLYVIVCYMRKGKRLETCVSINNLFRSLSMSTTMEDPSATPTNNKANASKILMINQEDPFKKIQIQSLK